MRRFKRTFDCIRKQKARQGETFKPFWARADNQLFATGVDWRKVFFSGKIFVGKVLIAPSSNLLLLFGSCCRFRKASFYFRAHAGLCKCFLVAGKKMNKTRLLSFFRPTRKQVDPDYHEINLGFGVPSLSRRTLEHHKDERTEKMFTAIIILIWLTYWEQSTFDNPDVFAHLWKSQSKPVVTSNKLNL